MALNTETKVGVFFLIGLAILGFLTFKVEDWGALFRKQAQYTVHFPHASGLKVGDMVAVAGMKVGEIKEVRLTGKGVVMVMGVDETVRIRKDAVASIAWGGLLGNRFIDISLGSEESVFLAPGSEIANIVEPIEISDVLAKLDKAAGAIQGLLQGDEGSQFTGLLDNLNKISDDIAQQKGTIGKLVGSDEMYKKLDGIADDLQAAADSVSKILADNDERVASIIKNLDEAVPQAREAFASIKKLSDQAESGKGLLPALLSDEQMYTDFKDSLAQLNKAMDDIETTAKDMREGKGLIGKLVNDEQIGTDFSETLASVKAIAQRIEKGDNTLARLSRDEDMYADIKKLLDDARETLRSAREQVPVGTFASILLSAF